MRCEKGSCTPVYDEMLAVARLLLDHGADVNIKDKKGRRALDVVAPTAGMASGTQSSMSPQDTAGGAGGDACASTLKLAELLRAHG